MLADVPYVDGIGNPFFKAPPIISFSPMISIIYPVSIMGRKRAKKQVITLDKLFSLYGFMLIEPNQGIACITRVLYSSKSLQSRGFYPIHKPADNKRRDQTHLGKIWRSTNSN